MKTRFAIVLACTFVVVLGTGLIRATTPGTSKNVQLVGQNSLFGRGMNAAMAIYQHFAYIGNRTDGFRLLRGVNHCHRSGGLDDPLQTMVGDGGENQQFHGVGS